MGLRHRLKGHMARHRGPVTHHEIFADAIFFVAGAFVATLAVFIFDIHWNLYPGGQLLPPARHIFSSPEPYYFGVLVGGLLGIFLTKLLLLGLKEENGDALGKRRKPIG